MLEGFIHQHQLQEHDGTAAARTRCSTEEIREFLEGLSRATIEEERAA